MAREQSGVSQLQSSLSYHYSNSFFTFTNSIQLTLENYFLQRQIWTTQTIQWFAKQQHLNTCNI